MLSNTLDQHNKILGLFTVTEFDNNITLNTLVIVTILATLKRPKRGKRVTKKALATAIKTMRVCTGIHVAI
jgi:hypothetical protein